MILRDLDYVGVVKEHKIVFNMPNSWCKNTHSKMADEVIVGDQGFMEMLLRANDTASISYVKTIDNIANVTQLNTTYKYLIDSAKNDSWKPLLMDKCESLNAKFNQELRQFETISA